ncbi:MAG TPA: hypothetical protein VGM83_06020 [Devosiaceae bacterium]|jgi:hypothetical protein
MKLTWFGGTTVRIHIGGQIFVADPDQAPAGIDRTELVSGADRVITLGEADAALPVMDPMEWRRRRTPRGIDEDDMPSPIHIYHIGAGAALVDAVGEPPLALIGADAPRFGRWADDAVVVLFGVGEAMSALAEGLLEAARPRLVALAGDGVALDFAIAALRERLDGAGLMALEPGLAVEV